MSRLLLSLLMSLLFVLAPTLEARAGEPKRKARRAKATRIVSAPKEAPAPEQSAPPPSSSRAPTRIDFDDRLIQGQTNAAGSVYLYDRKPLRLAPMVKGRRSFLAEVERDVVGQKQ